MSFIYRIEHPDVGIGPYVNSGSWQWTKRNHNGSSMHPSPYADGILNFDHTYKCGFDSMEKLNAWFNEEELSNLEKLGYIIVVIPIETCEHVLYGYKQLAFK